jgi:hypothetical protein
VHRVILSQYSEGLEYNYKYKLKTVSNYSYFCLLYNIDNLCLLGGLVGNRFPSGDGTGPPMLAVCNLLHHSVGACMYFLFLLAT